MKNNEVFYPKTPIKDKLIFMGIRLLCFPYIVFRYAVDGYLWAYDMGCFVVVKKGLSSKSFWKNWKIYREYAINERSDWI